MLRSLAEENYAQRLVQIKLSQQYTYDREQYTDAKTQFIDAILKKAKDSELEDIVVITETEHLQLRRPTSADLLILRTLWQDEKVRKFLGGTISNDLIDEKIISLQKHWQKYGFGQCSVIDKKHNQVIGICGIHHSEDGIELSYMFFPTSWGKGLAKEAVLGSLDYGFNHLKLEKIIAITQEANKGSCNLLERVGMLATNKFRRFDAIQILYEAALNNYAKQQNY